MIALKKEVHNYVLARFAVVCANAEVSVKSCDAVFDRASLTLVKYA